MEVQFLLGALDPGCRSSADAKGFGGQVGITESRSSVDRRVRVAEVEGSIPSSPTNKDILKIETNRIAIW